MASSLTLESAISTLEFFFDTLELDDNIDVDYDGKMLTIALTTGKAYLLNFHAPTQQIWLASPLSGAHHFDLKNGCWESTRDGTGLNALLAAELEYHLGYRLDLKHA